jgi:hypothetical protein
MTSKEDGAGTPRKSGAAARAERLAAALKENLKRRKEQARARRRADDARAPAPSASKDRTET